jgi:hypothetical protein
MTVENTYVYKSTRKKGKFTSYCKKCSCERSNLWKKNHPDEVKKKVREWKLKNKERYKKICDKYKRSHPLEVKMSHRRKKARRRSQVHDLTVAQWKKCLEIFDYSCVYCGSRDEMLHHEHIIPSVRGGGYTKNNIVPACERCNLSKNSSDVIQWYKSQPFYDEKRLQKIMNYMGQETKVE